MQHLRQAYDADGFTVVPGLFSAEEVARLNAEAVAICRGDRGTVIGADASAGDDDATLANTLAIHFPHKASPSIRDAMAGAALVDVLRALIGPNVKAMQTMLFVKRAGQPGQAWHQDEFFIPTRDRSLCGAWIALDDATIENGCLWMHPGSHAAGVLYPMAANDDPRFDGTGEAHGFAYPVEGGVPVEVKAGDVAFFNGYTLHRSLRNDAPGGFRRALVIHYCSAETLLPWPFGQPRDPSDFRDVELVAGIDPYAWKGREDLTVPFVRQGDAAQQAETLRQVAAAQAALERR